MFLIALTFWQSVERWDQWLFLKINRSWTNGVFDYWMPLFREKYFWGPLYMFLLGFMLLNFRKRGAWWSLLFICNVACTDMISSRLFKTFVARLRPCSDPEIMPYVRLLIDHCAGGFSFTSSHAANHFGMATFFYLTTRPVLGKWTNLAFLWAIAVCYAQVYVGVHYPLDVLGGAALGTLIGAGLAYLFNKKFGFAIFDLQAKA